MEDYFEIDFLDVETKKSGDAITLRYRLAGTEYIHVVDGGYMATGEKVVTQIKTYYGDPGLINHVVATHPDGDHTAGLRAVLTGYPVGNLWMNRPWLYADELMLRFARYTNKANLIRDLKIAFPNTAALEEIALEKGIPIHETFQGNMIGAFTVMAPTRERYIEKVLESEKTGVVAKASGYEESLSALDFMKEALGKIVHFIKSQWAQETFPAEGTSPENEMSVVQYATINGIKILLTADTGREGLQEVINFAPFVGLSLPGIDRFQVPHHGSRRNVNTELLDQILGERLQSQAAEPLFTAIISSAKEDEDHPRLSVVRAMHHRGARVATTEGQSIQTSSSNAPARAGWGPATLSPYPEEQEE
jgi:beta-lactamase superfamily II metal-dependent hydrolase